jgi:hypothetical protein
MDTLVLQYNVSPVNRVGLSSAELRKDNGQTELWPSEPTLCGYNELLKQSRQIVSTSETAASIYGSSRTEVVTSHLESLQAQGRLLRQSILPDEIVRRLEARPSIRHIVFRCDPLLNGVPYGHIYLWNDFLCFSYAIGKQLLSQHRPQAIPLQVTDSYKGFSIVDPDNQLTGEMQTDDSKKFQNAWDTFRERWGSDFVKQISFGERTFRSISKGTVEEVFQRNQFVNFVCHHVYNEKDPSLSGYVLKVDEHAEPAVVFTAGDLLNCLTAGDQRPRLILSVSCESGITRGWEADWPQDDRLHGIVDSTLRLGILHYIGTLVKIPAVSSVQIVLPFYTAIASGQTIGESLRKARLAFRSGKSDSLDPGTIIGLAFVLYGDPSVAYFCGEGHCTDGVATVGCTHVLPNGSICGRIVCPKEPGFDQRRCKVHWVRIQTTCSAGHKVENTDALHNCSVRDCANTFCQDCIGAAKSLCWFHSCHNGHEVKGNIRKSCTDPQSIHKDEKRTVCPSDDGWMRGLCDECLVVLTEATQEQPVCPHDGRFITKKNPWSGVCADPSCNRQTCSKCAALHEATMYCQDPTRSKTEKDSGWLDYIERYSEKDPRIVSRTRLREIAVIAEQFQANVLTNVKERIRCLSLMPRLSLPISEIIGPQARVLKVQEAAAQLGRELSVKLQERWDIPLNHTINQQWQPPDKWQQELSTINQLQVHVIQSTWGRPVILAVSTLGPVEFRSKQGPVIIQGDADHINIIKEIIRLWWLKGKGKEMPDLYLLVLGIGGWITGIKPQYSPGFLTVLAKSQGDGWAVSTPPIDGMPAYIRSFIRLLEPETTYMRMESIRKFIEEYLKKWNSVTVSKVQEKIEQKSGRSIDSRDILSVFQLLVETDNYVSIEVNKRPALRPSTAAERAEKLIRRRWVGLVATVAGIVVSIAIWQFRPWILCWLPDHWISWTIATVFCVLLCQVLGQFLSKLGKFWKYK